MFIADWRGALPSNYNLYFLGDIHEGRIGVIHQKLKQAIKNIENDKNGFAIFMGDAVEAITPQDKRYSPFEQCCEGKFQRIELQCENVAKIMEPIKNKFLAWLIGNHEEKIEYTMDVANQMCKNFKIDIPHGGRSAKILISNKIKIFVTHGSGTINSRAGDPRQREVNESLTIKRRLMDLQGDCILMGMGHIHKLRISEPFKRLAIVGNKTAQQIYPMFAKGEKGFIPEDYRYYFSTGCFVTGWIEEITTYIEKAMYPPTELGMIKVSIKDDCIESIKKMIY